MRLQVLTFLVVVPAVAIAQAEVHPTKTATEAPTGAPTETLSGRLRDVRIATGDVFAESTAAQRPLAALVNALHWTTREQVIAREVWFQRGAVVGPEATAELERNLRALGLFADVTVRLVPTDRAGEVDLEITTRDRLTLSVGAGGSYVGGVTGLRAVLGETNVLGYGNRLVAAFVSNSEEEYRGSLSYTDLHVLDSWHTGTVRLSRTDEGESVGLELRRPFKHLADPRAYGLQVGHDEQEIDYYRGGSSVAQVRDIGTSLDGDVLWAEGPSNRRRTAGFVFEVEQHDYGRAMGSLGPDIRVPGDTTSVFVGPTSRWQFIDGYRKVEGLDTLDYVQDITLGVYCGITTGFRWRDEAGLDGELQTQLMANVRWAAEPLPGVFTNLAATGGLRSNGKAAVGWHGSLGARAFAMVSELDTLAGSVVFDAVEEKQGLPIELTLGEDSGLRGYPSREFAGTARLRTNFENRFDTGLELATLRFGLVAFFDTGWVGFDENLGRPYSSVGLGLRIGSTKLLGDGVVRIDFAKPLDDVVGESDGWKLSVSVGQVFGFRL